MKPTTLTSLLLTGTLALSGCRANHSEYEFNGTLGEEQVRYYGNGFWEKDYLEIITEDGTKIKFCDHGNYRSTPSADWVEITREGGPTARYHDGSSNPAEAEFFQEVAQPQFEEYLRQIMEINTSPLTRN